MKNYVSRIMECLKKLMRLGRFSWTYDSELEQSVDQETIWPEYRNHDASANLIIQILKIAKGTNTGISTGDYDEEHKILRQRFHQTLTKLSGRDKVDEIVQ